MESSRRVRYCVFLMLLLCSIQGSCAAGFPAVEWQELLGGNGEEIFYDLIAQTSDGGYILAGVSESHNSGDVASANHGLQDIWVVKLDGARAVQWQRLYGGNRDEQDLSFEQTQGGGYIFAASTLSGSSGDITGSSHGLYDVWVVSLDPSGNIQWQKLLGGQGEDRVTRIRQTDDGGYLFIGSTTSVASGDVIGGHHGGYSDVWVVKLDSAGTIQWQKLLGGSGWDRALDFYPSNDGGYILTGPSLSNASGDVTGINHGHYDGWIVKLDPAGAIQWQKLMGGNSSDYPRSIVQTSDGGYILTGHSSSGKSGDITATNHGGQDVWIVRLDPAGTVLWQKLLGGSGLDEGITIEQTADDGFILIGRSNSGAEGDITAANHGGTDIWVVKLDKTGTIQWENLMGGQYYECGYAIRETPDNGFIFAGYSDSSTSGDVSGKSHGAHDFWVVKLADPSLFIDILPIGSRQPEEKFTIRARTNIPAGTNVLVEVMCSSFTPTGKSKSDEFHGVSGVVQVQPPLNDPINMTSFDLDLSPFAPGTECMVQENASSPPVSDTEPFSVQVNPAPTTPGAAGPGALVLAGAILCGFGTIRWIVSKRK